MEEARNTKKRNDSLLKEKKRKKETKQLHNHLLTNLYVDYTIAIAIKCIVRLYVYYTNCLLYYMFITANCIVYLNVV